MTKSKINGRRKARIASRQASKGASRKRAARALSKPAAKSSTKQARVIAMLKMPAGVTIAGLVRATDWQVHSVRGFLTGIVRKKLGLNLISEKSEKGRIYRIKDGKDSVAASDRVKQAA